ncbi:DUF3298 and DUF4163 domain-containing protein [uncultured Aquimarina sp.]|uniref:DUF3298 and DUF4163 domain-containing protein n=1 Tax=uncultured Aquimarina sp. TaxID=575652 RepID=UPI0026312A11|nr:DUF3298 and DUF4163 domain-containing protein [uncultured Aquimarina sp.]
MINRKTNTPIKFIFLLVILSYFYSCEKHEPLRFQKKTISIETYFDCENTDCVITEVLLLESISENDLSEKINKRIEKAACDALNIEDDNKVDNIENALKSFNSSYLEMKKEFPDEIIPYEASINCDISFQNENMLSVLIESYIFTGGAHGSGNSNYLNIDLKTGDIINNEGFIKDDKGFKDFAEKVFRETHNIPKNESINSTGYFFENDTFHLPSTIGFTEEHIILLYNQYEVSSYAEGPIEIKLSKEKALAYLNKNVL